MLNSVIRRDNVVVKPVNMEQLADWMLAALKGRTFKVISKEADFEYEPFVVENCRLDESVVNPVKFYITRMQILFCIDANDDIFINVGGFGKLTVHFKPSGFEVENSGVGSWQFVTDSGRK